MDITQIQNSFTASETLESDRSDSGVEERVNRAARQESFAPTYSGPGASIASVQIPEVVDDIDCLVGRLVLLNLREARVDQEEAAAAEHQSSSVSAAPSNPEGSLSLSDRFGEMLEAFAKGKGFEQIITPEEVNWLKAQPSKPPTNFLLAECYYYGAGVEPNRSAAKEYFGKASLGDPRFELVADVAMTYMAIFSLEDSLDERQTENSLDLISGLACLEEAATKGIPLAQYELGKYYLHNCEGKEKEGRKWIQKAAIQGMETAEAELQRCEWHGAGTSEDADAASSVSSTSSVESLAITNPKRRKRSLHDDSLNEEPSLQRARYSPAPMKANESPEIIRTRQRSKSVEEVSLDVRFSLQRIKSTDSL